MSDARTPLANFFSILLEKATVSNMWEIAAIVEVQRVAKGRTY